MSELETERPIVAHVIGRGLWPDLVARIPRPVFAFGSQSLFRVMLHGTAFSLPIADSEPARGFFTTFFVAADTIRAAEAKARARVLREWIRHGADHSSGSHPVLAVEEIEALTVRFRWRSGGGFLFYNHLTE